MIDDLWQDLRLAGRAFRREPGFALLAVTILSLGVGAATAMFSLVNTLVLGPLPHPEAERLVRIYRTRGIERSLAESPGSVRDFQAGSRSLEGIASFVVGSTSLGEPGSAPETVWTLQVSSGFFPVLRAAPLLGRVFGPDDDRPGAAVAVLSWKLWHRRFAEDRDIVGRIIHLGGEAVTVVGVMPPSFDDPLRFWGRVQLWRPSGLGTYASHTDSWLSVLARLRPGVTLAAAQSELGGIAARIDQEYRTGSGVRLLPLSETGGFGESGRGTLWLSLGLALFVLSIAVINLAGVQLVRLAGRAQERAVRLALGASVGRLVRQTLVESALLSLAGGALGLLLATAAVQLVGPHILLGNALSAVGAPVRLDGRVMLFAAALVVAAALGVGSFPAWSANRQPAGDLRRRGTTDPSQPRLRQALVVGEMALALVLLAAGGLFVRGLARLGAEGPGWRVDGLLTARVVLADRRYGDEARRRELVERLRRRLTALPGADSVALATWLPMASSSPWTEDFAVEGAPPPRPGQAPVAYLNDVSPEFFSTLGLRLREGRLLTSADAANPVVVINETMARALWPGESALGKRIGRPQPRWSVVVGVVSDARIAGSLEAPVTRFQVYRPLEQGNLWSLAILLRGSALPALGAELRRAVAELDGDLPLQNLTTAYDSVDRAMGNFALTGWIVLAFAGLGLALAALGVYGLFSGFVVERTRELGLRMALGARAGQILWLVLGKGLRLAVIGAVLGLAGALAASATLTATVPQLPSRDPAAVAAFALLLVLVALLACLLPARRAATLAPMVALRRE